MRSRPTTRILPALALTQPLRVASSGLEKRLCPEANRGLAGCWKLDFRGVVGRAPVFMLSGFISSYLVANILGTWDLIGLGWTEKAGTFSPLGAETFFRIRPDGSARPPANAPTNPVNLRPLTFVQEVHNRLSLLCVSLCRTSSPLLRNPFFFPPKGVLPGGGTETRDSLFLFSPSSTQDPGGGSRG